MEKPKREIVLSLREGAMWDNMDLGCAVTGLLRWFGYNRVVIATQSPDDEHESKLSSEAKALLDKGAEDSRAGRAWQPQSVADYMERHQHIGWLRRLANDNRNSVATIEATQNLLALLEQKR